eukprot:CAMPEP_0183436630 /NCGR_PEP_ID=MMETSP0370-20130417/69523_1 /TAXON_ID=268820 /ORGANISM="Peridinium aciculiferum, Strain PAER-2" /LENGTH=39 /DNA_ID= /DNA_START= /DNA_END= /DNA_ORIENTATION=
MTPAKNRQGTAGKSASPTISMLLQAEPYACVGKKERHSP